MKSIKLLKHYKKAIPILLLGLFFITSFNSCSNKCDCEKMKISSVVSNDTAYFYGHYYIVYKFVTPGGPDTTRLTYEICNENILPKELIDRYNTYYGDIKVVIDAELMEVHCGGQMDYRGPFIKLTSIKKLK